MIGPVDPLADRERTLVGRARAGQIALRRQDDAEVIEAGAHRAVVRAEQSLANRQTTLQQRAPGDRITREERDVTNVVERRRREGMVRAERALADRERAF